MSKERPILFSAPMVRAILEGRKTQTRRVMKPQPEPTPHDHGRKGHWWPSKVRQTMLHVEDEMQKWTWLAGHCCPYGQPGDRLWVRETFQPLFADGVENYYETDWKTGKGYAISYPATGGIQEFIDHDDNISSACKPSIHMPRWASRITLEIVSVRVERLNQISREDAIAEGITSRPNCFGFNGQHDGWSADWSRVGLPSKFATQDNTLCESDISLSSPQLAFQNLWETINGHDSWDENPWVWVIEFERVESGS